MGSIATQYRLLDFMKRYGRGMVTGSPGVGKTRLSAWCSVKIASSDPSRIIIFSSPLRKLRDFIYYIFRDYGVDPFKLLGHDEYEADLSRCVEQGNDYFICLKHHLDAGNCSYHQHIDDLISYIKDGGQVVVSTHRLGVFSWLLLKQKFRDKKITLIVDEGEDFFYTVSQPVTEDFLVMLKHIDKRIYRKIRAGLKKYVNFYYYQPLLVSKVLFHSFVISATLPQSMIEVLIDDYDHPLYQLRGKKSRDTIIYLDMKLYEEKKEKWLPKVIQLLDQVLTRVSPVGLTVRSKDVGEVIVKEMLNRGWRVSHDTSGVHVDPFADLWILTIGGKLYRGVSFRPHKGRIQRGAEERYDFPIGGGMYQYGELEVEYDVWGKVKLPTLHPLIQQMGLDPWRYHKEVRDGVNVQAVFRFNRYRDEQHLMVVLDKRLYTAMNVYLRYYVDTSKKIVCRSWDELMGVVRKLI